MYTEPPFLRIVLTTQGLQGMPPPVFPGPFSLSRRHAAAHCLLTCIVFPFCWNVPAALRPIRRRAGCMHLPSCVRGQPMDYTRARAWIIVYHMFARSILASLRSSVLASDGTVCTARLQRTYSPFCTNIVTDISSFCRGWTTLRGACRHPHTFHRDTRTDTPRFAFSFTCLVTRAHSCAR